MSVKDLQKLRIGHGFDVHRFAERFDPAKPLILAGVKLPVEKSLKAHSDGDLVLHALAEQCSERPPKRYGRLFSDSEPVWRIFQCIILQTAWRRPVTKD